MNVLTTCGRCGQTITLVESGAPRFVHPSGEAVCPVDNSEGEQDSGEPEDDLTVVQGQALNG